ncbi:haloacid dehalogenase-like hydrolase [Streptomyces sp. ITFR-6]|uniref:HAD family hydrolase n=1 Tax=Streptomyces sp. ITFR-6 TaxID=3075197 RepID=UPI00288B9AF3|nr:haloacid dehalogenase-like hydrolase [Streptomyces sp. ITFR-6]WNI34374.1 haloacid dehalogenase-like hydrolase [Streptomyces sp. ITFR-6]
MKLVLWDIDHTLIATRGVGRELFGQCFEHVTGQPMQQQALVDGMTEPVIFRETARLHGIDTDRAQFEAFARCSAQRHQAHAHELRDRGHALPGAAAALAAVAEMDDALQSVVTGNIRPVAEIKLAVFGLDAHIQFSCGGYGEDHDERAELVRTAMTRTARTWGTPLSPADVLLIGDTPADIAAGREAGVPVLAVATGRTALPELQQAEPTMAVTDLRDLAPLLALLT